MAEADESKKDLDPKAQVKCLKAALKIERKRNAKLQEEIADLSTRLKDAEEEIKEKANKDVSRGSTNLTSVKDKELIVSLGNQLKAVQGESEEFKKKCMTLEASLEKFNNDQIQVLSQYTNKISLLSQKNEELLDKDRERELVLEECKLKIKEAQESSKGKGKSGNEIVQLKQELIKVLTECKSYKDQLEQVKADQTMMNECNAKNKAELAERILGLEAQLKGKEDFIMTKENEISALKLSFVEEKATAQAVTAENQ